MTSGANHFQGVDDRKLKFGDTISFYSKSHNGYVNAGGLIDFSVYVTSVDEAVSVAPHLRDARFQVVTLFQFTALKALKKYKWDNNIHDDDFIPENDDEYAALADARDKESDKSASENERMRGTNITYGSPLMLLHVSSGQFLTVVTEIAGSNSLALRVRLSDADEGSSFVFRPAYQTVQPGAVVRMSDTIYLTSQKYHSHDISVCELDWVKRNTKTSRRLLPHEQTIFEVNASNQPLGLKLVPIARPTDRKSAVAASGVIENPIHGGDVIALLHKDIDSFLYASMKESVRFRKFERAAGVAHLDSNNYWLLEYEQAEWFSGPMEWGVQYYRLRHLTTGLYLGARWATQGSNERFLKKSTANDLGTVDIPSDFPEEFGKRSRKGVIHQLADTVLVLAKQKPPPPRSTVLYLTKEFNKNDTLWRFMAFDDDEVQENVFPNNVGYLSHYNGHTYLAHGGKRTDKAIPEPDEPVAEGAIPGSPKMNALEKGMDRRASLTTVINADRPNTQNRDYHAIGMDQPTQSDVFQFIHIDDVVVREAITVDRCLQVISQYVQAMKDAQLEAESVELFPESDLTETPRRKKKKSRGSDSEDEDDMVRGVIERKRKEIRLTKMQEVLDSRFDMLLTILTFLIRRTTISNDMNPLTRVGVARKSFQKALREQGLAQAIMNVICLPFDLVGVTPTQNPKRRDSIAHPDLKMMRKLLTYCYRLLTLFCLDNMENRELMSAGSDLGYIPVIQTHLDADIAATLCLMEIFRGNRGLLVDRLNDDIIRSFVRLLSKNKNPNFVRFLEAAVTINKEPLFRNQVQVLRQIMRPGKFPVLFKGKVEVDEAYVPPKAEKEIKPGKAQVLPKDNRPPGSEYVFKVQVADTLRWINVNQFYGEESLFNKEIHDCSNDELMLRYHVQMIHLLSALCLGRNRLAFKEIVSRQDLGLSYYDVLKIVFHPWLPYQVREAYAILLERLYVDCDPYRFNNPIKKLFPCSEPFIDDDDRSEVDSHSSRIKNLVSEYTPFKEVKLRKSIVESDTIVAGGVTEGFTDLKTLGLQLLSKNKGFDSRRMYYNQMFLAVLRNMKVLVYEGFFAGGPEVDEFDFPEDFSILVSHVVPLLDGRDDKPSGKARFEDTEENQVIFNIKFELMEIVRYVQDAVSAIRVNTIYRAYDQKFADHIRTKAEKRRLLKRGLTVRAHFNIPDDNKRVEMQTLKDMNNDYHKLDDDDDVATPKPMGTQVGEIAGANSKFSATRWSGNDLSKLIKNVFGPSLFDEKISSSTRLKNDYVFGLLDMTNYSSPSIVDSAYRLLGRHMQQRGHVARLCYEDVIVLRSSSLIRVMHACREDVFKLFQLKKYIPMDARSDRLTSTSSDPYKTVSAVLERLIDLCDPNEYPPNTVKRHQNVMNKLEAHTHVLNILAIPLELTGREIRLPEKRDVYQLCYTFLTVFCHDNRENQNALFPYTSVMLGHVGIEGLNVADTIAEILRDNKAMIDSLEPETYITFVDLLKENKNSRWLRWLEVQLLVRDQPNRPKQMFVLKTLLNNGFLDMINSEEDLKSRKRFELLVNDEHKEDNSRLQYHKACLNVLAKCCVGKVRQNEVKVQAILTFERAIDILVSELRSNKRVQDDARRFMKHPYLVFIMYVYLETDNDVAIKSVNATSNGLWELTEAQSKRHVPNPLMVDCADEVSLLATRLSARRQVSDAHLSDEERSNLIYHKDLVANAICPFVRSYLKNHYSRRAKSNERVIQDVLLKFDHSLSNLLMLTSLDTFFPPDEIEGMQLCAEALKEAGFVDAYNAQSSENLYLDEEDEQEITQDTMNADVLYQEDWFKFVEVLSAEFGIDKSPGSAMLGDGMMHFCKVMADDNSDKYMANLVAFANRNSGLKNEYTDFSLQLLWLLRGMLFVDGKLNSKDQKVLWRRFIQNEPPALSSDKVIRSKQIKYASYGAAEVGAEYLAAASPELSAAAALLMESLLWGGNAYVQNKLVDHFHVAHSSEFFSTISNRLKTAARQLKARRKRVERMEELQMLQSNKAGGDDDGQDDDNCCPGPSDVVRSCIPNKKLIQELLLGPHGVPVFVDESEEATWDDTALHTLKLLEVMTMGRHSGLQDLMLHQPDSLAQVQVVAEVVDFATVIPMELSYAIRKNDVLVFDTVIQVFKTLESFVQGPNTRVQSWLIDSKIVSAINRTLDQIARCPEHLSHMSVKLRTAMLRLLLALIEGTTTPMRPMRIIRTLDWERVHQAFMSAFSLSRRKASRKFRAESIEEVNLFLFLARILGEWSHDTAKGDSYCELHYEKGCTRVASVYIRDETGYSKPYCIEHGFLDGPRNSRDIRDHEAMYVRVVEISHQRRVLPLYFHNHTISWFSENLSASKHTNQPLILNSYDNSASLRLSKFFDRMFEIEYNVRHRRFLLRNPLTVWIPIVAPYIRRLALLIALMMNIINTARRDSSSWTIFTIPEEYGFIRLIMMSHVLVSFLMTITYLIENTLPTAFQKMMRQNAFRKSRSKEEWVLSNPFGNLKPASEWGVSASAVLKPFTGSPFDLKNWDVEVYYFIFYPVFSVMACLLSPLFYVYHLMDFMHDAGVQVIMSSITRNFGKLVRTFIMAFLLLYLFAIIAYKFFDQYIDYCDSLFTCISGFVYTFAANTDPLAESFSSFDLPSSLYSHSYPWTGMAEFIFALIFSLIFVHVISSLVTGLIVDGLGGLRDEEDGITDNLTNKCFVCGLPRVNLDESGHGFDQHLHNEHNYWDYIRLLAYIEERPVEKLTGLEQVARVAFLNRSVEIFPTGKAFAIEQKLRSGSSKENTMEGTVKNLEEIMKKRMQALEMAVENLAKQQQKKKLFGSDDSGARGTQPETFNK